VTAKARALFDTYTRGATAADVQRVFTRDTPEAYRYFTRGADTERLAGEPWYRRWPLHARLLFTGFTMRLSPARRMLYAFALASALLGVILLFEGFAATQVVVFPFSMDVPSPVWVPGTVWLLLGFIGVNLLILMEVADRLSLKGDLEIARDIQLAMLPGGLRQAGDAVICGLTQPANTVGGDLYDILERPDGRVAIVLGDVAGKGSPAALLMALLVAMLRTLVDEGLEPARLAARLNTQVIRHSPASRFITLFFGLYDPRDGSLEYVNAGHLPPLIRRADGRFERIAIDGSGIALGMFEHAEYEARRVTIHPGDTLVLYSDGITEAENAAGAAFDEQGLQRIVSANAAQDPQALSRAILGGAKAHAGDARLVDDLSVLVLKRAPAVPPRAPAGPTEDS
jgi:hypothetical protein